MGTLWGSFAFTNRLHGWVGVAPDRCRLATTSEPGGAHAPLAVVAELIVDTVDRSVHCGVDVQCN
jgi:hypothetical protein